MGSVSVVNIIPQSLSGETNQDSEPNLAVNPQNTNEMVATAFTPPPMGGAWSPIFISTDGGTTWSLRNVVPGNDPGGFPTNDITVAFGTSGGTLYASILRGDSATRRMQILRSPGFSGVAAMAVLSDRTGPDQPWVVAQTANTSDRLWVGNNAIGTGTTQTATVDHSADAQVAAPTFVRTVVEARATSGQDGPPVRLAAHSDGTVYAAFVRVSHAIGPNLTFDVVVTRDDNWGTGATAFTDLLDSRDNVVGTRVADDLYSYFNAEMGQERLGADLSIAVDPNDSSTVWVAWGYKYGGPFSSIPWTVDVARSTDRGRNWAPVRRTIVNGKNPALAVNSRGALGFLYQEFTGTEWVTRLEVTADAFDTPAETHVLHRAPSTAPARQSFPYLGDYVRLPVCGPRLLWDLLWQQRAGSRAFPERGELPAQRRLADPTADRPGRCVNCVRVNRPVLLQVGRELGDANHPARPAGDPANDHWDAHPDRAAHNLPDLPDPTADHPAPAADRADPGARTAHRTRSMTGDAGREGERVLLVSMPFGPLERPALSLGLLKAHCRRLDIMCDTRYLTFRFADLVGVEEYLWACSDDVPYTAFAADWVFAEALYGPRPSADTAYIDEVLRRTWQLPESDIDRLRRIRARAEPFLSLCLTEVPWADYTFVGFTSVFQQNLASLALASPREARTPRK